jgi:adenine/guanine phosphoribosyltransferase-like PRPP-binding protein
LFAGLALTAAVPPGPVLLVDDVARSTWTLTACAALLHDAGCGPVLPLVAHRRP